MNVNRRTMLYSGMAGVAGLALTAPGTRHASARDRQVHKLGLVTYNLARDWDLPTILERCEATGFEGVELRTTHAHNVEVDLSATERQDVKARFANSPVELIGLGSAFDYHTPDADELRTTIEATKEYMQLCHDVGGSGVKVRPNRFPDGVSKEKTLEQIGTSLREVGEFGADIGVAIRLEVHGAETSLLPNIARMIEIADHPNVGVCWNSNSNDLAGEGFEHNFDLVARKINAVHIRDLYNEDYPYRRLFTKLHEAGFTGYCMAEIHGSEDPIRLMHYYRGMFLALQDAL